MCYISVVRRGKLAVDQRPGLKLAIDYMSYGDILAVQEVNRLGRNLLEGLLVLNELFEAASRSRSSKASPLVSTPSAASSSAAELNESDEREQD